ncbi:hypothetical protein ACBI99_24200 [Nonomuraea sp. ATR24]|uniref:hypothetical protein n=1 Tax=unclassified Nonomuraea TaxID=2593643 RepID=UPI0033D089A1
MVTDLTKTEGDPTPRADLLEARESVSFEVTLSGGKRINATAPAWSPSGIAPAVVMIALVGVMVPGAFAGLAMAVAAPGWITVAAALIAFCVIAGGGAWVISKFADRRQERSRKS